MTWTYQQNPDLAIIEVAFVSNTSARDLQECTSKMISIEKEEGINRFLVDNRKMQLDASLLDVHAIPAEQYVIEQADPRGDVELYLPDLFLAAADIYEARGLHHRAEELRQRVLELDRTGRYHLRARRSLGN